MKNSGWRDPLAADYVLRSTAQAHIRRCRYLLINSTKVWECVIVFTVKLIFLQKGCLIPLPWQWHFFFSRGYQLFSRQDCSFPAVLCNSKWMDHKFAVSCLVKGRSALNYSLFLKRKYNTDLRLSPCLHNCSWDSIIFGLFGSAQSLFFGTLPPDGYRRTRAIQQPHAVSDSL